MAQGQAPTEGLSYDPNEPVYWEEPGLKKELDRIFDICIGCRLCFNLCGSFKTLFDAVDSPGVDGDLSKVGKETYGAIVEECFQCKLCHVKCPYTPEDGHPFQLDFPRLMLRAKAVHVRKRELPLIDQVLGDPVLLGKMVSSVPGAASVVNFANSLKVNRWLLHHTVGIHKDKKLPEFHGEPFEKWFRKREKNRKEPASSENGKVVLFYTCFTNYNDPQLGKDVVEVFERNKIEVVCPKQTCCGMPALDGGDIRSAMNQAQENIASLKPFVDEGYTIVVPNPTCSYMMRNEYPTLVGTEDAKAVAAHTMDVTEYLMTLAKQEKLDTNFKSSPGEVAYHVPCHLRAQKIGLNSRDLMKKIPGAKVRLVAECCGHDGTWAMKAAHFADSLRWGEKAFKGMKRGDPDTLVTDCPLAAVQIEQGLADGRKPIHPIQVLKQAYEGTSAKPIPEERSSAAEE